MLVKLNCGRRAGEIVDLPLASGLAMLRDGRASDPKVVVDEVAAPLVLAAPEVVTTPAVAQAARVPNAPVARNERRRR